MVTETYYVVVDYASIGFGLRSIGSNKIINDLKPTFRCSIIALIFAPFKKLQHVVKLVFCLARKKKVVNKHPKGVYVFVSTDVNVVLAPCGDKEPHVLYEIWKRFRFLNVNFNFLFAHHTF